MNNNYLSEPKKIRKKREYTSLGLIKNPFTKYINIGGRVDEFLTEEEESELVEEYKWCNYRMNLLENNLREINAEDSKQKILDEISELKNRIDEVKEEFIVVYRQLVKGRARSAEIRLEEFKQGRLSIEDLLQAGSIGLVKALNNYLKDPKRRFYVNAKERIKWEIYDEIIKDIRDNIPDNTFYLLKRLDKKGILTPKELVENSKNPGHSHLSLDEARNVIILYRGYLKHHAYYNDAIGQDKDEELSNFTGEISKEAERHEIRKVVFENFDKLYPQQKLYIGLRLGVGKILEPMKRKELREVTGLNVKETWNAMNKWYRRCKLSLKESTICGILNGNLNGKKYNKDEIKDTLNVDDKWIKFGEMAIKELAGNPILNELR